MLDHFPLNEPLLGSDLQTLFEQASFALILNSNRLPRDASLALKKIEAIYGQKPDVNGRNILGIELIRKILFDLRVDQTIVNGLSITAPHTHWAEVKPVIFQFEKKFRRYIIGHLPVDADRHYFPVSFIFYNGLAVPYEWIDDTVIIDRKEWSACIEAIKNLSRSVDNRIKNLGIAIDFRFRNSLHQDATASLELPLLGNADKDYSYIINKEKTNYRNEDGLVEQVSWHPFSECFYKFSEKELMVKEQVTNYLLSFNNAEDQQHFLQQLSDDLAIKKI